jgi:hypothetical protein
VGQQGQDVCSLRFQYEIFAGKPEGRGKEGGREGGREGMWVCSAQVLLGHRVLEFGSELRLPGPPAWGLPPALPKDEHLDVSQDTEIVCFAGTRSSVVCAKIPR